MPTEPEPLLPQPAYDLDPGVPFQGNNSPRQGDPTAFAVELPVPDPPVTGPPLFESPAEPQAKRRRIPNFGHTALFFILAVVSMVLTELAAVFIAVGTHIFGKEPTADLLRDPRLLIPTMAISYLISGVVAWAVFRDVWKLPFTLGIRWNPGTARRRLYAFLGLGVALSVSVQFLSNFLPIPKALPIDDFFRTPSDVWMVAVFGTLVAPVFEELAFRGFLFPSLASGWDWVVHRSSFRQSTEAAISPGAGTIAMPAEPRWSVGAIIFSCTITSIGFALLHADQLAHSWAPLLILFGVSIALCLIRLFAHSLAASTLVHATYNCTIFVLMFFATDGFRHLDKLNQ